MRRPSNQPNATDGASRLLWLRLTEPPTAIANEGDRHSARLLAGVLLVLVTLGFASAIVQILAVPGFTTPFAIIVGALLLLGVAYGISRTKHYRLAAVLASLVPVSAGAAVGLVAPADPVWFAFMGLGPIVASGFLPARHVGGVAGFTVVATLLVLFAEGALSAIWSESRRYRRSTTTRRPGPHSWSSCGVTAESSERRCACARRTACRMRSR
ncbi:MAG: hypothetical protein OEY20_04140 [Gemmatimonadota bacterium]|nr:hypothetical protein [Gemmatimonadota bacterium]MDH5196418.1 hypothetical protein [Gemmatimonadota bacterium]